MTIVHVQFSDSAETTIISYFSAPQDPDFYQNQGQIPASDVRWATFYDSLPASAQGAALPSPG